MAIVAVLSVACKHDKELSTVEVINGVPRLIVQGEVVRPRSLYMSPTYFVLASPTD